MVGVEMVLIAACCLKGWPLFTTLPKNLGSWKLKIWVKLIVKKISANPFIFHGYRDDRSWTWYLKSQYRKGLSGLTPLFFPQFHPYCIKNTLVCRFPNSHENCCILFPKSIPLSRHHELQTRPEQKPNGFPSLFLGQSRKRQCIKPTQQSINFFLISRGTAHCRSCFTDNIILNQKMMLLTTRDESTMISCGASWASVIIGDCCVLVFYTRIIL